MPVLHIHGTADGTEHPATALLVLADGTVLEGQSYVDESMITGESLFATVYTHTGQGKAKVAFAAPYPGTVIPMKLDQLGGKLARDWRPGGLVCAIELPVARALAEATSARRTPPARTSRTCSPRSRRVASA